VQQCWEILLRNNLEVADYFIHTGLDNNAVDSHYISVNQSSHSNYLIPLSGMGRVR